MKNRFTIFILWSGLVCLICTFSVFTQQKDLKTVRNDKQSDGYVGVALVFGNSAYKFATVLTSPVNDANDMSNTLTALGFKVLKVRANATLEEMDVAIAEFGRELKKNGGVGVFYYSGHGVQSNGKNYLIPVDANIPLESFLKSRSMDTDVVLETMAKATTGFKVVILDACRNNPFAKSWGYKTTESGGGLAGIYSAPRGSLIAYATSPNDTAADGFGKNSPYTEVLLRELVKPGVKVGEMFDNVREILDKRTSGDQTPWESTSLIGAFCFASCSNTRNNESTTGETAFWQEMEKRNTIAAYQNYLAEYPNGDFAKTAKLRLANLKWEKLKPVAKQILKYDIVSSFSEGLAVVRNGYWFAGKTGVIDITGKEIVPLKYDSIGSFSEGLAFVHLSSKWGFIDKTGKEVIPLKYSSVSSFSEGLACVAVGEFQSFKYGFIDKTGREVIPTKYDYASSFSEGLAGVKLNGNYGFLDKTGYSVIPFKYDIADSFSEGLARVDLNDKDIFIDRQNNKIIPLKYYPILAFSEGLAGVCLKRKCGFIDRTGKVVTPLKYDFVSSFKEGFAVVTIGDYDAGKRGFIDKTGKEITSIKYSNAESFSNGLAQVWLNGKVGFIDKTGKEIIPIEYNSVWCQAFREDGFIGVKSANGRQGFVDIYGNNYFSF